MTTPLYERTKLVAYFKELCIVIRILKHMRKLEKNQRMDQFRPEDVKIAMGYPSDLFSLRKFARDLHIAWSEFKGRTRDQIEKPRKTASKYERPDEERILSMKKAMAEANPHMVRKPEAIQCQESHTNTSPSQSST